MSVEFAQQTELARINKRACQRCTSMQTQSDEEEVEEREIEEQTPRASPTASPTSGSWLEEAEKEKLERELEERNAEIRKLKEELQKTESGPDQVGVTNCAVTSNVLIYSPLSPLSTNFIHFI